MSGMIQQSGILASPQMDVLWMGGVLIVMFIAVGFVLLYIRKVWDPRQSRDDSAEGAISLEQIEAMHQAGQISDEEFSVVRRRLLKISSPEEESKSKISRSDSIMDDSEEGSPPDPTGPNGS